MTADLRVVPDVDDSVKPEDTFTAEQLAAIRRAGLDIFYVRAEPLLFGEPS